MEVLAIGSYWCLVAGIALGDWSKDVDAAEDMPEEDEKLLAPLPELVHLLVSLLPFKEDVELFKLEELTGVESSLWAKECCNEGVADVGVPLVEEVATEIGILIEVESLLFACCCWAAERAAANVAMSKLQMQNYNFKISCNSINCLDSSL